MSSYKEKINNLHKKYFENNLNDTYTPLLSAIKQTFESLLIIIDNKTDEEFETFYNKYMYKIKLKESHIDSFENLNDFIDKIISVTCANIKFYLELNIILENVIEINKNHLYYLKI
jgi:hypothetical protein